MKYVLISSGFSHHFSAAWKLFRVTRNNSSNSRNKFYNITRNSPTYAGRTHNLWRKNGAMEKKPRNNNMEQSASEQKNGVWRLMSHVWSFVVDGKMNRIYMVVPFWTLFFPTTHEMWRQWASRCASFIYQIVFAFSFLLHLPIQ